MNRTIQWAAVLALVLMAAPAAAHEIFDQPEPTEVRVEPRADRVALTFDDGPHPIWTPVILDLLDQYDVTATFFITGFRAERHPELVAEIVRRGHSVQPHGWAHALMTSFSSTWVRDDLQRNVDQIVAAGGATPTCWRPPHGVSNDRVRGVAADLGLDTALWDADSRDYVHSSANLAVRNVLDDLRPGDVILMHDLYGFIHDDSLPVIIEAIRARGWRFDTICDDRPLQGFEVERPIGLPDEPV